MTFSPAHLFPKLPQDRSVVWWVALSGGLDSCVLLHALVSLKLGVEVRALHVNHQISPNATAWQGHCVAFCESLNVPCEAISVNVENSGRGIEDAAREARYSVFTQYLGENECLLTAHHADDQAETMLLRLMRGTGTRGLAAMAQQRPIGKGFLCRPLLGFTRADLEAYALANDLRWVDDESNANDDYDRNLLRNKVFPVLRERWPEFAAKWQQTADICAQNEILLDELADGDLKLACLKSELVGTSISLAFFEGLSLGRRHNLLRRWLRVEGLTTPEQHHLAQIERQLLGARQDTEAQVSWGNLVMRIFRNRLYALPLQDLPAIASQIVPFNGQMNLPNCFQLSAVYCEASELPLLDSKLPDLHCRFRQGGERCKPVGRAHSQTLKRLFQEYEVSPWLRDALPLIYSGDTLVAVADLWICEGFQVNSAGYRLKYLRNTHEP